MYLQGCPPPNVTSFVVKFCATTDGDRPTLKQLRATSSTTFYEARKETSPCAETGTKHYLTEKHLLSLPKMSYIISIDQRFSCQKLDGQAALRLAELRDTFAAFKYNLQGLPRRQDPRLFVIDHLFSWHTFYLFTDMFHPPGRLLDWTIDNVCEFIRLSHFKVYEHFLSQCLSISIPQESPSVFVTNNTCDILFNLKTCGYLLTAKQIISIADQSEVAYDTFFLSDLLAAQTSNEFRRMISRRYQQ